VRRINDDTDYYRRNLPHLQRTGADYFVTFRLAGSLPVDVIKKMKENQRFSIYDGALDSASTGPVWLKDPVLAQLIYNHIIAEAIRSYRLDCFTIMSNHVHMVLSPFPDLRLDEAELSNRLRSVAINCSIAVAHFGNAAATTVLFAQGSGNG